MVTRQTVSIVGCGWLGLPLAINLISKGYQIKGSTTTRDKLVILKNKGIDPYLVHFDNSSPPESGDLLDTDILIINIPPGRRSENGTGNYRQMADYFSREIPHTKIKKIILVSSTSVYSDTNTIVSETDLPLPSSPTGKLMLEVENQFLAIQHKHICIIRCAGLVGPERHPSRFFKDKTGIPNGLSPVNLIHRDDVIGIIIQLIANDNARGVYNASSPFHPTKQEFYGKAAEALNKQSPVFIPEKKSWKVISSVRVEEELTYAFKFPDLRDWLKED